LLTSLETFVLEFTSSLPNNILEIIKNLLSAFGTIVISLIIGIYMLIDYENIIESLHKIFPKKGRNEYIELTHNISVNTRKVVNSTLFVAFLVFLFDTIGFAAIGLKSAMLFGLFCGLTDLIPYIGPYIGGGVAVVVGFTQGPIVGIGVLIIAVIVQLLESYILQPVVMTQATNLSPVIIIVGLLVFGYFFGIPGMVIATPCLAIIKEIFGFIKMRIKRYKEGNI
jgi:predicted PurR-regulated permease PerM